MTTNQTVGSNPGIKLPARITLAIASASVITTLLLAFTATDPFYLAPFRESQTAISADYLIREPKGGMLAFQVPVLGAPWRLPYEFPLFQQLTAWIAQLGISISQAGRLLDIACFILCVIIMAQIWKDWNLSASVRQIAIALFVASPVYCIYATSHMPEALALLFALLSIWTAWRFIASLKWGCWICSLICGIMAALVKITTWLPAGAIVAVLGLIEFKRGCAKGDIRRDSKGWIGLLIISSISLVVGVVWSKWCAGIRALNPMENEATLFSWIFGTFEQRLSLKNWILVAGKHLLLLFGPLGLFVPIFFGVALLKGARGLARRFFLLSLFGYAIHMIVFFRLHLRHDYYVFGAGVFLISAVIFAWVSLQERKAPAWSAWLPAVLALSMAIGGLVYMVVKRDYHDLAAEEAVKALRDIKEPGALLMFGFDWSPRVPFAVGRKALMVISSDKVARALECNKNTDFAAAVVLGSENDAIAAATAEKIGLEVSRRYYFWKGGYIMVRPGAEISTWNTIPENPVIKELEMRVPPRSQLPDGVVYKRSFFNGGHGSWMEIIVKRDADAFYVHNLSLIRIRDYFEKK